MSIDSIVVVDGRKKLHTFQRQTVNVNGSTVTNWQLVTPRSAKQKRHQKPGPKATTFTRTNMRSASAHQTSKWTANGNRTQTTTVFHLGADIPPVRRSILLPILDGLADAADRDDDLPAGVRIVSDEILIESGVLRVYITRAH